MKEVIAILIIVGGLAVMIIFGLDRLADAESRKVHAQAALAESQGRARATIIEAQAESRLHAAQASAITSAALIPWGILGVLGLLGLAIVALAFVVIARKPQAPPMIERQIIYVLPEGQPRRELWRTWSDTRQLQPIREAQDETT